MKYKWLLSILVLTLLFCVPCTARFSSSYNPSFIENKKLCYLVGADDEYIELTNYNDAKNPTYAQLLNFLKNDKTDNKKYDPKNFMCGDAAERVHNNAEYNKIKAAFVSIRLKDGTEHALNMFKTIDKGTVYIDCTPGISRSTGSYDSKVSVKIGKPYDPEPLFKSGYNYKSIGTIAKVRIFW